MLNILIYIVDYISHQVGKILYFKRLKFEEYQKRYFMELKMNFAYLKSEIFDKFLLRFKPMSSSKIKNCFAKNHIKVLLLLQDNMLTGHRNQSKKLNPDQIPYHNRNWLEKFQNTLSKGIYSCSRGCKLTRATYVWKLKDINQVIESYFIDVVLSRVLYVHLIPYFLTFCV